jgi:hypothetical protein
MLRLSCTHLRKYSPTNPAWGMIASACVYSDVYCCGETDVLVIFVVRRRPYPFSTPPSFAHGGPNLPSLATNKYYQRWWVLCEAVKILWNWNPETQTEGSCSRWHFALWKKNNRGYDKTVEANGEIVDVVEHSMSQREKYTCILAPSPFSLPTQYITTFKPNHDSSY